MPHHEETPRKTQDTLECHSAGLGTPWDPPGGAGGGVQGEGSLGVIAQTAAPTTQPQISVRKWMDGWMDGLICNNWFDFSLSTNQNTISLSCLRMFLIQNLNLKIRATKSTT